MSELPDTDPHGNRAVKPSEPGEDPRPSTPTPGEVVALVDDMVHRRVTKRDHRTLRWLVGIAVAQAIAAVGLGPSGKEVKASSAEVSAKLDQVLTKLEAHDTKIARIEGNVATLTSLFVAPVKVAPTASGTPTNTVNP